MLLHLLGLPALAGAIMIPSTVSMPEFNGSGLEAFNDFLSRQTSRLIRLDCPGCSFRDPEKDFAVSTDVESDLIMRFAVSDRGDSITLNGVELHPFMDGRTSSADDLQQPTAPQALSGVALGDAQYMRNIFYESSIQRGPVTDDDPDFSLVHFDFEIKALDDERVNLDKLTLRLVKDDEGRHRIIDILQIPTSGDRGPTYAQEEPTTTCPETGPRAMLCRAKAAMKMPEFLKPCHQSGQSVYETWRVRIGTLMQPPDTKDVYNYPPQTAMERLSNMVQTFISGFMIPIVVGIAAGVTASLLGMVVGTFVGWLWFKIVRGGRRGDVNWRQQQREMAVDEADEEEKRGLLPVEEEETPPPVYVEKE